MAIYRGPGGAGDATNDATSQAILANEAALAAAASQAAAAGSASSAATSATNAASSATSAANSATTATTEASNAATSATNAANSAATATIKASEASTSATNAAASESAAASSATAAASSATSASNSATLATAKASEASTSATSAASSANAAAASATTASTQATNASNSATAAATSATNASNSATAAASSATSAASSASTATTQATNAASSATAAATSASNAATSETNAAASATSAASSATTATTQATNASNSASASSTSATNAANSATSASNSATAAAASAASINPTDLVHISGTETITGAKTFSTNPTISSGTANGVAYLNGSKVLTTGSALTFDGTRLGIANSSPAQLLQIGAAGADALIRFSSTGLGYDIGRDNASGNFIFNATQGAPYNQFVWQQGGSEQMRLTSTGLGIGVTPGQKLDVYGGIRSQGWGGTAAAGNYFLGNSATAAQIYGDASLMAIMTNGAERIRITSAGNVGIGTGNPTSRLEVSGDSTDNAIIKVKNTNNNFWKLWNDNGGNNFSVSYNDASKAAFLTDGRFQFNSGYGSVATAYGCRAWVNFNGQGTVAIRGSGNVSSITDIGTGDYGVNFTTAMPDANYCCTSLCSDVSWGGVVTDISKTTSQQRVFTYANAGTAVGDPAIVNLAIFR